MNKEQYYQFLIDRKPFDFTHQQQGFLQQICSYLIENHQEEIFVLKGYAGTGKTTMVSFVVNHLTVINKKAILLAPTGRAAKVISGYSQRPAHTIHKHIYYPQKNGTFKLKANKAKNVVYFVDESSMIPDVLPSNINSSSSSLLEDLIRFVFGGENCQLVFIGDTAQLPPVGLLESPALSKDHLKSNFPIDVVSTELTEVVRQKEDSGILYNATEIRTLLNNQTPDFFRFDLKQFKDIQRLTDSYDVMDAIQSSYQNKGLDETIFVVRSNKRANIYNQHIRQRILDIESEISVGDLLMVVKNNYHWLKNKSRTDFIANGDIVEIKKIYNIIDLYGFRFARVQVRMVDFTDIEPFETIIHLNTLTSDTASLTREDNQKLYDEVMLDYQDEISKYKKLILVKANEYFNALQVKFAYAITCHKAQGGQWKTVFIEQPYMPDGLNEDNARWLYTALTRAQQHIYLLGFQQKFFIQ